MKPKTVLMLIAAILFLIVLFQNLASVPLRVLFWTFPVSLLLVILVPFLAGAAVGWLAKAGLPWTRPRDESPSKRS